MEEDEAELAAMGKNAFMPQPMLGLNTLWNLEQNRVSILSPIWQEIILFLRLITSLHLSNMYVPCLVVFSL